MTGGPIVPYIPPELRGNIARYCSQQTQGRLCAVDRLWAAETEPLLYTNIHLRLRSMRCEDSLLDFVDGVSRSPRRMSRVRGLLIENMKPGDFMWTDEALEAMHHLLLILPNLDDLRFRGVGHYVECELLAWVAWPDCPFRLRSLYASWEVAFTFPTVFDDVLRQHMRSLDVLAIEAEEQEQLLEAAGLPDDQQRAHVRPTCAVFGYFQLVTGDPQHSLSLALSVAQPDPAKIAAVARSLAADPSPDFAWAPVDALRLDYTDDPGASLVARAFASHFPGVYHVTLTIPWVVSPAAIAATATPFRYLELLHIPGRMQHPNFQASTGPKPWPARKAWAMGLVRDGCPFLREVVLTDGLVTSRDVDEDGGLSDWYDGGAWLDRLHRSYAEAQPATSHPSS